MDSIATNSVTERVIRVINERVAQQPTFKERNRDDHPVTVSSRLDHDCQLDSLGRVELIVDLEDEFAIRITDCEAHELNTVGELVDAVIRHQSTATD